MHDDRNYQVVAPNGYRSGWLTQDAALSRAAKLQEEMRLAGWSGVARVYFRNGTEVEAQK